jgi:hypothetical protein
MKYEFRIIIDDETLKEYLQYREIAKSVWFSDDYVPVSEWKTVPKLIGSVPCDFANPKFEK